MTTNAPSADHDRWLHLTLEGDRHAAASLLTLARRRGDPLLGLIARAVCERVEWFVARKVLDGLPEDALSPQALAHLQKRLEVPRIVSVVDGVPSPDALIIDALSKGERSALLPLITGLRLWSRSADPTTWQMLYACPLPSLVSLSLSGLLQGMSLASLDPEAAPWVANLRVLDVEVALLLPSPPSSVMRRLASRFLGGGARAGHTPVGVSELLMRLSRCPSMALTSLALHGDSVSVDAMRALVSAPWVNQLVSLRLNNDALSSAALQALADAPLTALRALHIATKQPLQAADVAALASAPLLMRLSSLSLPAEGALNAALAVLEEPAAQPPGDAALRALALLSSAPTWCKPHHISPHVHLRDARLIRLGELLRPRLEALVSALPASISGFWVMGMERALACLSGVTFSVSEQAHLAALIARYARAVWSFGTSHASALRVCIPNITDDATLGALCARLLAHSSTASSMMRLMSRAQVMVNGSIHQAIWQQAALMTASRRCAQSQRAAAVMIDDYAQGDAMTPHLWAALADLGAPGPAAAVFPQVAWPPLIAPDGVFYALWTRLDPEHPDKRDDPGVFQSALRALRLGAACAFACDRFFVSAAAHRADLLEALLSSLEASVRERLLLRLCPRRLDYAENANTDRPLGPLGQALLRSAALRAYFPPFAPDWPRPASGHRARAKWAMLASFNLCAVAQAEGEGARAKVLSLREREDPLLQEIAQQRLNRLDRLRRIAVAPDLVAQSDDPAPKETSP